MPREPADPTRHAAWRRARRGVARTHHPDVGGDVEAYLAKMAEVDRRYGVDGRSRSAARPTPARTANMLHRLDHLRQRARRRSKQSLRSFRSRLPRKVPGSRRYFDL